MVIDLIDQSNELTDEQAHLITSIIQFAGKMENVSDESECSITIVGDSEIQEMNQTHRGIDEPTDVLSFDMQSHLGDVPLAVQEQIGHILGDIIVSIDRAYEQANEYNHSFEREVGFLVVHGFLHLLGYTHETEVEEKIMFSKQTEILQQYGLER